MCFAFFFTVDSDCVARGRNIWSWRRSTGKCSRRRKPSIPGRTGRGRNIPAQLEPPLCSGTQGTLWPAPSSRTSLCPVENLLQRYIYKQPGVLHHLKDELRWLTKCTMFTPRVDGTFICKQGRVCALRQHFQQGIVGNTVQQANALYMQVSGNTSKEEVKGLMVLHKGQSCLKLMYRSTLMHHNPLEALLHIVPAVNVSA